MSRRFAEHLAAVPEVRIPDNSGRARPMDQAILGHVFFTDGVRRPVYPDGNRQFVVVDGEKVYGLFLIPQEEWSDVPLVVTL
jgi:hypothetical protein